MLALTHAGAFRPSEAVLCEAPMPAALFEQIRSALAGHGHRLPTDPEQGRRLALQYCRHFRAKRTHRQPRTVDQIIPAVQHLNRQLARWCRDQQQQESSMASIRIDNIDYDLDTLSDDAKAQLRSIQFVDQELARLQMQMAAMQTARNAYVNALKAALPVVRGGDTIKLS